ncbi:biopolymer transporter ExbD [bacterium]|nr:biopolymer transporter ExbD [bacterium]
MSLTANTLKPGVFAHHLSGRGKNKRFRRGMLSSLMLTPMVDMFSLLVIFLLQAFSASPELLVMMKGVTLPSAITGKEIKDAPVIAVAPTGIFLDQKEVGPTEQVLKDPTELLKRLHDLRKQWLMGHSGESFSGEITLQAHKEIPSTTISQLMGILPSAHYGSIQLAVISGG